MPIVLHANFPHASCPPCQFSACQLSSMPIVRMPIVRPPPLQCLIRAPYLTCWLVCWCAPLSGIRGALGHLKCQALAVTQSLHFAYTLPNAQVGSTETNLPVGIAFQLPCIPILSSLYNRNYELQIGCISRNELLFLIRAVVLNIYSSSRKNLIIRLKTNIFKAAYGYNL